ncbi:MAG: hypothetical protein AB7U75_17085 [Hyphomicrobiaceae bacterium]
MQLKLHLDRQPAPVFAGIGQIEQVMLALARNVILSMNVGRSDERVLWDVILKRNATENKLA